MQETDGGARVRPAWMSTKRLIAGAVALALGALVIVGFVAPGFLRGNPDGRDGGGVHSQRTGTAREDTTLASEFIGKFTADMGEGDEKTVVDHYCDRPPSYKLESLRIILSGDPMLRAGNELSRYPRTSLVRVPLAGTVYGKRVKDASVKVKVEDGEVCAESLTVPLPLPEPKDALPMARKIVSWIKDGDRESLLDSRCEDAGPSLRASIEKVISANAQLAVGKSEIGLTPYDAEVALSGDIGDRAVYSEESRIKLQSNDAGTSWCINDLYVHEAW